MAPTDGMPLVWPWRIRDRETPLEGQTESLEAMAVAEPPGSRAGDLWSPEGLGVLAEEAFTADHAPLP